MKNINDINTELAKLESKKKSTLIAYLLWFFLLSYYFYLGKWKLQLFSWLLIPVTIGLMLSEVNETVKYSVFTFSLLFIVFYPMFTIPSQVSSVNKKLSKKLLDLQDEKQKLQSR